jgi:hypothetical protein
MKMFWIFLSATLTAINLLAGPVKIADIRVEAEGTNRIVILNNKKYSFEQVTGLLKTRTQQMMIADHISYAAAQSALGGKVSADLLDASRPVPFIHITQGQNATVRDLDMLNSVFRQSGLTNIVLTGTANNSTRKNAEPGVAPYSSP